MASRTQSQSSHSRGSRGGNSRRGFAAMSKSQRERIASMGGRASHGGRGSRSRDYEEDDNDYSERRSSRGQGRQGFASMDPSEQRRIASLGGRASHGGQGRSYYEDEDEDRSQRYAGGYDDYDEDQNERYSDEDESDYDESGYSARGGGDYEEDYDQDEDDDRSSRGGGGRGFASMDPDRQRRIASMGGRASHGGGRGRSSSSRGRSSRSYRD